MSAVGHTRERRQQLGLAQAQLLGDESSVALTTSAGGSNREQLGRAARRRHVLLDEPLPGRHLARAGAARPRCRCRRRPRAACRRRGASALGASSRSPLVKRWSAGGHVPDGRCRDQRRVQVVGRGRRHERLRQGTDSAHEVGAPVGIELTEDVVEQEQRRLPGDAWSAGRAGRACRPGSPCAAGRARRTSTARARQLTKTTSSRCGPISVAPFHISFSRVSIETAAQRVACRFVLERRGVRHVAQLERRPRPARSPGARRTAARASCASVARRQSTIWAPSSMTTPSQ